MTDGRLPYFNLYTGDMRKRTERMSPAARGHFLWLLMAQWDNGPLPDSIKQLRLISPGLTESLWDEIAPQFEAIEAGLVHLPLEALRSSAEQRKNTATTKARDAAIIRWAKAERRKRRDAKSIATSNAPSTKSECLEHCSEQCLGDAMSESESESESPPTHSGGMGMGRADAPTSEPQTRKLTLVGDVHRSADATRQSFRGLFGDRASAEFDALVRKRIDIAATKFIDLGVSPEMANRVAWWSVAEFHWDTWLDQVRALVKDAGTKNSPAGWLEWRLKGDARAFGNQSTQSATA